MFEGMGSKPLSCDLNQDSLNYIYIYIYHLSKAAAFVQTYTLCTGPLEETQQYDK